MTALGLIPYFLSESLYILSACGEYAFLQKARVDCMVSVARAELCNDWVGVLPDPGM